MVVVMNPEVRLVASLQDIPKKAMSVPLQNGFRDLKSVFPARKYTSKG